MTDGSMEVSTNHKYIEQTQFYLNAISPLIKINAKPILMGLIDLFLGVLSIVLSRVMRTNYYISWHKCF